MEQIIFTPEKLTALKKAYTKAVNDRKKSFTFEGNEFVTDYAKYLIEHLTNVFKK